MPTEGGTLSAPAANAQAAHVAATTARAEDLGGKVVVAPMELDDGMVVAYLTGPNGSMFALFSPKPHS